MAYLLVRVAITMTLYEKALEVSWPKPSGPADPQVLALGPS